MWNFGKHGLISQGFLLLLYYIKVGDQCGRQMLSVYLSTNNNCNCSKFTVACRIQMCMMSISCPLSCQLSLFSVPSMSCPRSVNQCPFVTVKYVYIRQLVNIYKQGGLLHSPPAAPNLYFRSCRSSYIPATECCKKGCERADLAAMKRS